ncbi:MAG: PIG-L deacetylase family protein [Actinomycetota bacterium]
MRALPLGGSGDPIRRLLVIGAHSDDAEIGCGGTVLRLVDENPGLEVTWVVLTASGSREGEARDSAEALLAGAGEARIVIGGLRDGFLPYLGPVTKELFEGLKAEVEPDLILTHQRNDLHQDHRVACELTWNTWRDHLILEYEIPKWDGDMGAPNVFVPLDAGVASRKLDHLMAHFASQRSKRWFTRDVFEGLMRLRGVECGTGAAEAFYGRKLALMT